MIKTDHQAIAKGLATSAEKMVDIGDGDELTAATIALAQVHAGRDAFLAGLPYLPDHRLMTA